MIRTLGNILLIICMFISVYSLRDTLKPVVQKVGTFAENVISTIEHKDTSKKPILDITATPENEISAPGPLEVKTPAPTENPTQAAGITRADIIYWTNQARSANGNLPALRENKTLDTTATAKTDDLFAKSYFEHTSPTGVTVATQADAAGYEYIMIGENLALGTFANSKAIVDAWMNSPGHRANILNDRYSEIGIGVRKGTYQGRQVWIATQHFGLPRNACPVVDENLKALIDTNQARINGLKIEIDAKKQQIDSTSQMSPSYNAYINEYNALVRQYNDLVVTTKSEIATYNEQVQAYNQCIK